MKTNFKITIRIIYDIVSTDGKFFGNCLFVTIAVSMEMEFIENVLLLFISMKYNFTRAVS